MPEPEWIDQFDTEWQLTDWLKDYATIYAKPEYEQFDNNYEGYVTPNARPDFLLDFNNAPLIACFIQHGEDLEALSREFSPQGRLSTYIGDPGHGFVRGINGKRSPEMAVIATQFSPFGRLLADECEITNPSLNSLLSAVDVNDDFITHFLAHQLGNINAHLHVGPDNPIITRFGALVGRRKTAQTFKPPAALVNDTDFTDPTWVDLTN